MPSPARRGLIDSDSALGPSQRSSAERPRAVHPQRLRARSRSSNAGRVDPRLVALASESSRPIARLGQRRSLRPATLPGSLHADIDGFSLHAEVLVPTGELERLEPLFRYIARPPIATQRLELDGGCSRRKSSAWSSLRLPQAACGRS